MMAGCGVRAVHCWANGLRHARETRGGDYRD